jgi:hypothetical protein
MTLARQLHFHSTAAPILAVLSLSLAMTGTAQAAAAGARNSDTASSAGSLITYLTREHDGYALYSDVTADPAPEAINGNQIYWDIEAEDGTHAEKLGAHIRFMADALEQGAYPRNWDKFFVIDAAMHAYVHTDVSVDGRRVQILKEADNSCAYAVIKAHAEVVSSEFFATGDTSTDHSSVADAIIASAECSGFRDYLEAEVAEHWEPR